MQLEIALSIIFVPKNENKKYRDVSYQLPTHPACSRSYDIKTETLQDFLCVSCGEGNTFRKPRPFMHRIFAACTVLCFPWAIHRWLLKSVQPMIKIQTIAAVSVLPSKIDRPREGGLMCSNSTASHPGTSFPKDFLHAGIGKVKK